MDEQAFTLLFDKLKSQDERFENIEEKLDDLLSWKFKLAGATLLLSAIGGVVIQIIIAKITEP